MSKKSNTANTEAAVETKEDVSVQDRPKVVLADDVKELLLKGWEEIGPRFVAMIEFTYSQLYANLFESGKGTKGSTEPFLEKTEELKACMDFLRSQPGVNERIAEAEAEFERQQQAEKSESSEESDEDEA